MDERKRLELIAEAVRYCQRVQAMGMPVSCYTKALREPIHYLWERRTGKGKDHCAQFRSKATIGVRRHSGNLRYDHSIPFTCLQDQLLRLPEVTCDSVRQVLERHCVAVLITKDEEDHLNRQGLGKRMPAGWTGADPLARYARQASNSCRTLIFERELLNRIATLPIVAFAGHSISGSVILRRRLHGDSVDSHPVWKSPRCRDHAGRLACPMSRREAARQSSVIQA